MTMRRGELRAALALDPGFFAAMANLVAVDIARGDLAQARQIADRYVAIGSRLGARALLSRHRRTAKRRRRHRSRRFRKAASQQSVLCRRPLRSRFGRRTSGPVRCRGTRAAYRAFARTGLCARAIRARRRSAAGRGAWRGKKRVPASDASTPRATPPCKILLRRLAIRSRLRRAL